MRNDPLARIIIAAARRSYDVGGLEETRLTMKQDFTVALLVDELIARRYSAHRIDSHSRYRSFSLIGSMHIYASFFFFFEELSR